MRRVPILCTPVSGHNQSSSASRLSESLLTYRTRTHSFRIQMISFIWWWRGSLYDARHNIWYLLLNNYSLHCRKRKREVRKLSWNCQALFYSNSPSCPFEFSTMTTDKHRQYVWIVRYGLTHPPLEEGVGPYDSWVIFINLAYLLPAMDSGLYPSPHNLYFVSPAQVT